MYAMVLLCESNIRSITLCNYYYSSRVKLQSYHPGNVLATWDLSIRVTTGPFYVTKRYSGFKGALSANLSRFAAARIIFPYFLVSHAATKHGTGGASRGGIMTEGAIQVSHPYRDRIMAYTERLLMAGT